MRFDLSGLRANGLVEKLPLSRRYTLMPNDHSICLAFLKLFDRIYAPLTAGLLQPARSNAARQHERLSQLDTLYQHVVTRSIAFSRVPGSKRPSRRIERERYAVTTSLSLPLPALYAFIGGRGAQEKSIAELKGEFALDVVQTRHYTANCAWQLLSVLAYNVARRLQLDTIATALPRSPKRTYAYVVRSTRTLRFLLIAMAGRVIRIGGRQVLRLAKNPAIEALYARIQHALAA